MSETRRQNLQETPQERAQRIRRQRAIQEKRRRRRRKALILRGILGVIAAVVLIGVAAGISYEVKKYKAAEEERLRKEQEEAAKVPQMQEVDLSNVLHLSFETLIADPAMAFEQEDTYAARYLEESRVTVEEFQGILEQLYQEGYVLVSFSDLVTTNKRGDLEEKKLMLPTGKKALILSEKNVNYDRTWSGQGLASRMIVDESGTITCERRNAEGNTVTGTYDVVPCVETFISEHPDFSNNGARGILGLTGYDGILGYHTDDEEEKAEAASVIEALKNAGWEFACNGYDKISYRQEEDAVKEDIEQWKKSVGAMVGETSILLFPEGIDLSGRKEYEESDPVYQLLKEQGFVYFCGMNISGPWSQLTDHYFRCSYKNVDGYRIQEDVTQDKHRFDGILDFTSCYDKTRSWSKEILETGTDGQDLGTEN